MSRPINDVVAEVNAAGYIVTNCFQLDNGLVQANLRTLTGGHKPDYSGYFGFATGEDMAEALTNALKKAKVETAAKAAKAPKPKPPADLDDDIADLI